MAVKKPVTYENALQRCAGQCATAEQSASSLRRKMKRWGVSSQDIERVIEYLYAHNFLNDSRYAAAYTRDKIRFNGWGRRKVSLMLRQEGLPSAIIAEAMQQIDEQEYRSIAMHLTRRKAHDYDLQVYEQKMKVARWLASRGFEQDLIFNVLDQCASSE